MTTSNTKTHKFTSVTISAEIIDAIHRLPAGYQGVALSKIIKYGLDGEGTIPDYLTNDPDAAMVYGIVKTACEQINISRVITTAKSAKAAATATSATVTSNTTVKPATEGTETASEATKEPPKYKRPTIEEVKAYWVEKGYSTDPQEFLDYYEERNWIDSKGNVVRIWERKADNWNTYEKPWKKKYRNTKANPAPANPVTASATAITTPTATTNTTTTQAATQATEQKISDEMMLDLMRKSGVKDPEKWLEEFKKDDLDDENDSEEQETQEAIEIDDILKDDETMTTTTPASTTVLPANELPLNIDMDDLPF